MTVVPVADPPSPEAVERAGRALASGHVVALPTDTVYGLAVDPFDPAAAERVFSVKRRPHHVELPVLIADEDQVAALASAVPAAARLLMARFWPGALTIVLPRRAGLGAHLGAGRATVGVRRPAHPVPLALCRALGPLAATSANLHGQPPLTTAGAVAAAFGGRVALVLDGGPCTGSPSTVVDCTLDEPRLLRQGRIPWAQVLEALGPAPAT
jgi:L-threonylcarbamoyladenylate synthase